MQFTNQERFYRRGYSDLRQCAAAGCPVKIRAERGQHGPLLQQPRRRTQCDRVRAAVLQVEALGQGHFKI